MYSSAFQCRACGECCRKGGPLLHKEDIGLVTEGHLPLTALVTLRVGELVHDPVVGQLIPLDAEAIKIAGTGLSSSPWRCVFLAENNTCSCYDHRPSQCRALLCTDTKALQEVYERDRLSRRDILPVMPLGVDGLAALAEAHEEQCSLPALVSLALAAAKTLEKTQGRDTTEKQHSYEKMVHSAQACSAIDALLEAVRYDMAFREITVERGYLSPALLDFVLGRPISEFLRAFGLMVGAGSHNGALTLQRVGTLYYPH